MTENNQSDGQRPPVLGEGELKLLRTMFEEAPMFIAISEGPEHRVKYINAAFRKLLGNRTFPPGTPASQMLPDIKGEDEEEVKSTLERLDHVYATGEPLTVNELKIFLDRKGNGTLEKGYYNLIYQPLKSKSGEVHGLFLAGYEVTRQVEAHQEKVHSEKRLRLALEGAQVGFWEADLKTGATSFASRQNKAHFGRSLDKKFTYDEFLNSIHPEDRPYVIEEVNKAIETFRQYEANYRVIWPDGSVHWLTGRGQCLYDEEGQPYRLIGVTVDITEHKQAEQKLKEDVLLRDNFLSIAAHELQTPVTSIKTRTELFEHQLRDAGDQAYAKRAGKIGKHVDQLSKLAERLLDMSRMQQKGLSLQKEYFTLGELIEEEVETLSQISHHKIDVQGNKNITVRADRLRIGQVLINLIENAIKYSTEAEKVIVRYRKEGEKVLVSVIDFGVGIPIEEREKIFDRFFKGGKENKHTYPGFGIGLFISAQIIRRHGGIIRVEDNNGQGSVFTFTLPVGDQHEDEHSN